MEHLRNEVYAALERERQRLGTVSVQFSYYERLVASAALNDDLLKRVHNHVTMTGSFAGL
jgi:hypothetical protein